MWPEALVTAVFAVASFCAGCWVWHCHASKRTRGESRSRRGLTRVKGRRTASPAGRADSTSGSRASSAPRSRARASRSRARARADAHAAPRGPGQFLASLPRLAGDRGRRCGLRPAVWVEGRRCSCARSRHRDARAVLSLFEERLVRPAFPFHAREGWSRRAVAGAARARTERRNPHLLWDYSASLSGGAHFTDACALRSRWRSGSRLHRMRPAGSRQPEERAPAGCARTLPDRSRARASRPPGHRDALLAAREDPDAECGYARASRSREWPRPAAAPRAGRGRRGRTTEKALTALGESLTVEEATAVLRTPSAHAVRRRLAWRWAFSPIAAATRRSV